MHGLPPASDAEIAAFEREAQWQFNAIRRLSLPRDMLARSIELSVILDRAALLEECGYAVRVATIFERAVTPSQCFTIRQQGRARACHPCRQSPFELRSRRFGRRASSFTRDSFAPPRGESGPGLRVFRAAGGSGRTRLSQCRACLRAAAATLGLAGRRARAGPH